MSTSNYDPFDQIHTMLRHGQQSAALRLLLDEKFNRIHKEFSFDKNHAWYCVGDIYFEMGCFDKAKSAFKNAIRSRPDDIQAIMAIGDCYDQLRRPKLAERYFLRALNVSCVHEENSRREVIVFNLANSLFDQCRMSEAIDLYNSLSDASAEMRRKANRNTVLAERYINSRARRKCAK